MDNYKLPRVHTRNNSLKSRWFISYYFRHPDTRKMDRYVVWISTKHKTLETRLQAVIQLRDFYTEKLKSGWSPFQSEVIRYTTLLEAFNHVLRVKETTSRPQSIKTYKKVYTAFKTWLEIKERQSVTLEQFNFRIAQQFCDYLKVEKGLNNRTYNNHLLTLRTFYNELIKREYTIFNPFNKIERLQVQAPEICPITKDSLSKLAQHLTIEDPALWLACQFVFYCFIRPNELTMLQPRFVNLESKEITIPAYISKNKIQQTVVIPGPFSEFLKLYPFREIPQDSYIFSTGLRPGKTKISPERFSERFRSHCKHLGLDHNFYDLKHTGAGMAVDNGVNVEDLRNQLRHSSLSTTTIYLKKFRSIASADLIEKFPSII